jgi:hypothetical protein
MPTRRLTTALALGLATLAGYAVFGVMACTVTTSDEPLDSGTADTGTGTTDTKPIGDTTPTDTGGGTAVIIPAKDLIGGISDDIRDFGGGSTKLDIVTGGRIAYAIGAVGTIESTRIEKDSADNLVNGRLVGLPAGTPVTITVTGYLRGLNGDGTAAPTMRVPWATTTCTATPSATADVTATCATKLTLIGTKGILFSSDVLPDGWCEGAGATSFALLRARLPHTGTATVSKTTDDCKGVIWVPITSVTETDFKSDWGISMEPKGTAAPCSLRTACPVNRKKADGTVLDIFVVGEECRLSNASTGGTCF